jgi:hypothetical protein
MASTAGVAPPRRVQTRASHNVLVTVAAETGAVGVALFAWLVGTALIVAFRRTGSGRSTARIAGLVVGVVLFAVFVHSLFYSGFLQDPLVWSLFPLAALAARESASLGRSAPGSAGSESSPDGHLPAPSAADSRGARPDGRPPSLPTPQRERGVER